MSKCRHCRTIRDEGSISRPREVLPNSCVARKTSCRSLLAGLSLCCRAPEALAVQCRYYMSNLELDTEYVAEALEVELFVAGEAGREPQPRILSALSTTSREGGEKSQIQDACEDLEIPLLD